jgi:hypothetical protein
MSEATESGQAAEGGADYEVIRRLSQQGAKRSGPARRAQRTSQGHLRELGSRCAAKVRVRTEHACVPRDIVQVRGGCCSATPCSSSDFGRSRSVAARLQLHRFDQAEGTYDLSELPVSTDAPYSRTQAS